jgi:hypothetical protein
MDRDKEAGTPAATPLAIDTATAPGTPAATPLFAASASTNTVDRWMSYPELAYVRRIDRHSAIKLASRQHWRRRKNNQGIMQVLVPSEWAVPHWGKAPEPDVASATPAMPDATAPATPSGTPDATPDATEFGFVLSTLDAAVSVLHEQLAIADRRAHAAEARADRAEQGRDGERARADALRDRLTTMQEQIVDARAALQAAESADARAVRAEASRDTERQRADRAEQGREADRSRADVLQAKLNDTQMQLTARQEVIDAAEAIRKAHDTRLARGRLRRAWDGWRGR